MRRRSPSDRCRVTRPVSSSTRRWWASRFDGIETIPASSDGEASPSASASVIASRAGSASAACTAARRSRLIVSSLLIDSIVTEANPSCQAGGARARPGQAFTARLARKPPAAVP